MQFAKEVKLLFPNAQRVNRGGMVRCCAWGTAAAGWRCRAWRFEGAETTGLPRYLPVLQPRFWLHVALRLAGPCGPCPTTPPCPPCLSNHQPPSSPALPQVVSELVESCRSHEFTDLIMVHEHRGEPDGLVVCHLPCEPAAAAAVVVLLPLLLGWAAAGAAVGLLVLLLCRAAAGPPPPLLLPLPAPLLLRRCC